MKNAKQIIILLLLTAFLTVSCSLPSTEHAAKTPEITDAPAQTTEQNALTDIALVYPEEFSSNDNGMHSLIEKYNQKISDSAKQLETQITYFYVPDDGEKLILDDVYSWADERKDGAIVLFYLNIQLLGEEQLEMLKDKNLTIGVLGLDYRGFSDDMDKELGQNELMSNLDFNIIMDCAQPLGQNAAHTFAKEFDGKNGYILLNAVAGGTTPRYYQSFFDEFDKQKKEHDISGIVIRSDYDDINMSKEDQISSLKDGDTILGVVDDRGVYIDEFWHDVLSSADVSNVSIFSNTSLADQPKDFNDANNYYYITEPLDKVVLAGIKTGIAKISGEPFDNIQTVYGELVK